MVDMNGHPITCHEGTDRKHTYSSTLFFISDLDVGGWSDDLKSSNTGMYICMSFQCTVHLHPSVNTDNP